VGRHARLGEHDLELRVVELSAPYKERPLEGPTPIDLDGIPELLRTRAQWACWSYEHDAHGRPSKPPRMPDGSAADGHDPRTWSTFDDCYDQYTRGQCDGVSYVFQESQGLLAFDLDHFAHWRQRDLAIVRMLGSYTEWSASRDGLHVWLQGRLPEGRRRRDDIEIYSRARFLAVTGARLEGTPAEIRTSPNLYAVWRRWVAE